MSRRLRRGRLSIKNRNENEHDSAWKVVAVVVAFDHARCDPAHVHGFSAALIGNLVAHGLATLTHEKVPAGGKLVECRQGSIDGPVSVGIDGRHGKRRNCDVQVSAAA